jgi:hypothetical protein
MSTTYEQMRAFERDRWARQADVLRAWLAGLDPAAPRGDALRGAVAGEAVPNAALAQMHYDLHRDLGRLGSAIAGKTPTAVDRERLYESPRALARDEATHTIDNAIVFLERAAAASTRVDAGAAIERAQRWIQRVRWELVDTEVEAEVPTDFSARILAEPDALADTLAATMGQLRALHQRLGG